MCLWVIWTDHNNIVFENQRVSPQNLFRCVYERRNSNPSRQERVSQVMPTTIWQAPPVNSIKVNTDAAVAIHKNLSVAAAVCRNSRGIVVKYGVKILHDVVTAELAESYAVLMGLQMAVDIPVVKPIVEADALTVINRLQQPDNAIDHTQLIVDDCIDIARGRDVVFQHIRRDGNVVTHALAKWGIFFGKDRSFDGEVPFPVNELVTLSS
ncbi:uncharacterized protein LOC126657164 [Mercurialis annua]|uniref:uncharacterized protein LOC126657164 n=1 Tax=Mercurialis annua TaxID=3986 RepID=UPI0021606167|nr:uncharacterized protein LOC126657164 [Mercurialis annua]